MHTGRGCTSAASRVCPRPAAHRCLQVRCHSSFDFLAALRTLRPKLDALAGSPAGLACVLIDNVAAHYYLDRAARGAPAGAACSRRRPKALWPLLLMLCLQLCAHPAHACPTTPLLLLCTGGGGAAGGWEGGGGDATREGAPLTLHRVHTALAAELRGLQQRHRVPIIATKHLLLPGAGAAGAGGCHSGAGGCWVRPSMRCKAMRPDPAGGAKEAERQEGWPHRETMLKPWQDLVTHRLLLRRGSDGGGGAAARLARWHTPDDPAGIPFDIDTSGIRL